MLGHPFWRAVSEPLVAAPDQHLTLGHARIIDAALLPQRNGDRVLFQVFRIPSV